MINPKMYELGSRRSVIREIFEYGKLRKQEVGEDKVYDFSIGNPSVEAPAAVAERVKELLEVNPSTLVHGYTSAQGDPKARQAIADDLNNRFGTSFTGSNVYLTCGAAASLTISLRSVIDSENQNVMVFAPFFTEYRVFIESMGASIQVVPASFPKLDLNLDAFENMINDKTVAVILNSPNNPTGVVYSEEQIMRLAEILNRKSAEFGHPIYIISDEPYRDIVFEGVDSPYVSK